jgi:hypothetical protein
VDLAATPKPCKTQKLINIQNRSSSFHECVCKLTLWGIYMGGWTFLESPSLEIFGNILYGMFTFKIVNLDHNSKWMGIELSYSIQCDIT